MRRNSATARYTEAKACTQNAFKRPICEGKPRQGLHIAAVVHAVLIVAARGHVAGVGAHVFLPRICLSQ